MSNNPCDVLNFSYKDLYIYCISKVQTTIECSCCQSFSSTARCLSMFLACHGFNAVGQVWDCESVTTGGG